MQLGGHSAPGVLYHWAAQANTGMKAVDVYETRVAADHLAQEQIGPIVAELGLPMPQISELDGAIAVALAEHPDGPLVKSFPRAGETNAAQLLAQVGDVRERFQCDDVLAMEGGVVPVTKRSGKTTSIGFRWACNKRLRRALTFWADNSRRASPWAEDLYQRARDRGADHPHAVRILARAWLRVFWRCWYDHKLYDPVRHRGAARLAA